MMRAWPISGLLVSITASAALACDNAYEGNEPTVKLSGQMDRRNKGNPSAYIWPLQHSKQRAVDREQRLASYEAQIKNEPEKAFQARNNMCIDLNHLGRAQESIEILKALELERPGEYPVAANLGTAYELTGQNELALEWIREGIRRNPKSHEGTEWIHVRVLQAKIELVKDPSWLKTHSLLELDFGVASVPKIPSKGAWSDGGPRHTLEEAADALRTQLTERLGYIDPPEAIVAELLFDLGNCAAILKGVEYALPVYDMARAYGVVRGELLQQRISQLKQILEDGKNPKPRWIDSLEARVGISAVVLIAAALILRRRELRHRAALKK